jgi:hypothetical protein
VKTKSLRKTKERLKQPMKVDSYTATVRQVSRKTGTGGEERIGSRSMSATNECASALRVVTDMATRPAEQNSLLMNTSI